MQIEEGRSEEMQLKYKECVDAEKQLEATEKELGMTPSQYETPDPMSLLNTANNNQNISLERLSEDRSEVPSEKLMKTIQKEVGNSIRIHNMLKRKVSTTSPVRSAQGASKRKGSTVDYSATASSSKRGNRAENVSASPSPSKSKSQRTVTPSIPKQIINGEVGTGNPYKRMYKEDGSQTSNKPGVNVVRNQRSLRKRSTSN